MNSTSKRFWGGIRRRLFAVILIILLLNILLLVVLGSGLFRRFYENSKVRELNETADAVQEKYNQGDQQSWEELYEDIFSIENRNVVVSIFSLGEDGEPSVLYHSKMRNIAMLDKGDDFVPPQDNGEDQSDQQQEPPPKEENPAGKDDQDGGQNKGNNQFFPPPELSFRSYIGRDILDNLPQPGERLINTIQWKDQDRGGRIVLVSGLDENLYLFIETPTEYIQSVADMAVQYSAALSIGILLLGAVGIYYVAGRFTRPIREIETVANQISNMDFSRTCPETGGDELTALSVSINNMSRQLQENIGRMMEANRVLQQDLERQQETDRMRRQFMSDVSHDFKTPLTLIVSYAEAIRGCQDREQLEEYCRIIQDEGNRLSQMVGRLLRLSRLESGMDKLEPSVFCLNDVLDDAVKTYRLPLEQKNMTVTRDYGGESVVQADYQKIRQVVSNLVENAIKYGAEGGEVRISVHPMGDRCRVEVWNNGSHISQEALPRIFDSFYRGDKARDRSSQSYGLGLAIVKTIMELHGEQYGVENISDGVSFWFCLPVVELED